MAARLRRKNAATSHNAGAMLNGPRGAPAGRETPAAPAGGSGFVRLRRVVLFPPTGRVRAAAARCAVLRYALGAPRPALNTQSQSGG